ncbi:MAG: FAD-linked oxidase C-terminal domain-containing protein [Limisphaerales bacterium]
MAAGFLPCALELADQFTLIAAAKHTGSSQLSHCRAHLILELDGQKNSVRGELPAIERVIRKHKPLFVERGWGDAECEKIWKIRREFSAALRASGLVKLNEDIVVPRGKLEQLFEFSAQLQKKLRPAHRLLRPRRRWQHPRQYHGGLFPNRRKTPQRSRAR